MDSAIVVVRASHCIPFIDFLKKLNAPLDKLLSDVGLTVDLFTDPNNLIPEHAIYALVENASQQLSIPDIGFKISEQLSLDSYGVFGKKVLSAPTLKQALLLFIETMGQQSNCPPFWLKQSAGYSWFCRQGTPNMKKGLWPIEQHVISLMIQLVREAAGSQWFPEKVWLQSYSDNGSTTTNFIRNSQLSLGKTYTAIAIPEKLLDKPLRYRYLANADGGISAINTIDTKNCAVLSHLFDQRYFTAPFNAKQVADKVGLNIRKLQRLLNSEKTSITELIAEKNNAKALTLLKDSACNILDISIELGYKDAANFARAFKKRNGVSPKTFRQQLLANDNHSSYESTPL